MIQGSSAGHALRTSRGTHKMSLEVGLSKGQARAGPGSVLLYTHICRSDLGQAKALSGPALAHT